MHTLLQHFNNTFIPLLPETRFFGLKRGLWRLAGAEVGDGVRICSSVTILGAGELRIGPNTWIGPHVLLCASTCIEIGRDCDLAPRVYIGDGTHEITPDAARIAGIDTTRPVRIGDGCWLCANSTILPGVEIGRKCVVAAGSVVTRGIAEDGILIAGVPAERKKKLK